MDIRNSSALTDLVLHCEWMVATLSSQVDVPFKLVHLYYDRQTRSMVKDGKSLGFNGDCWDRVGGSEIMVGGGIETTTRHEGRETALLHAVNQEALGDRIVGKGFRSDVTAFPSVIVLPQCMQAIRNILESGVALSLLQSSRLKPLCVLVFERIINDGSNVSICLTNVRRS